MNTSCVERPTLTSPPYPAELIQASKLLFQATLGIFGSPQGRAIAVKAVGKLPDLAEEINEIAHTLGLDPADVALANLSYDFLGAVACSTMVFATPTGPLVARNMDWFPPALIARASAILPTRNGKHAGFIGMSGIVTGLSNAGFSIVLNAIESVAPDFTGYPMLLYLRHVLDHASGYEEARKMLSTAPLMSGGLITLVGSQNSQRVVLERTPHACSNRTEPDGNPLLATNHYRLNGDETSCGRYEHMKRHANPDNPFGVLCHPAVMQDITSQHVFVRPARNEMKLYVPAALLTQEDHGNTTDSLRSLFG